MNLLKYLLKLLLKTDELSVRNFHYVKIKLINRSKR